MRRGLNAFIIFAGWYGYYLIPRGKTIHLVSVMKNDSFEKKPRSYILE
jgi:hypothetical protein